MPKDELQAFDKLQAGDKVRVALLRLAARQGAATVRCSLRPEARHPSYVLGVTCNCSAGLGMRVALRRLSFFQNPARCAPQARKVGQPAVAIPNKSKRATAYFFSPLRSLGTLARHYALQPQSSLLPATAAAAGTSLVEPYRELRRAQDRELSMDSSTIWWSLPAVSCDASSDYISNV